MLMLLKIRRYFWTVCLPFHSWVSLTTSHFSSVFKHTITYQSQGSQRWILNNSVCAFVRGRLEEKKKHVPFWILSEDEMVPALKIWEQLTDAKNILS